MLSIFDIFKIGIGPSSSHTVGPMWAGHRFMNELKEKGILGSIVSVRVGLYGSLALTGVGHSTDKASLLGLAGYQPDTVDPDEADQAFETIKSSKRIKLAGEHEIDFDYDTQLIFHNGETLPEHPNAMRIFAADEHGIVVYYKTYLSIGGGFIVCADGFNKAAASNSDDQSETHEANVPYPFRNASELIKLCKANNMSIAELVIENEKARHNGDINSVTEKIDAIWDVMRNCIERGLRMEGQLPMSGIKRRAFDLHKTLTANPEAMLSDHFAIMDWVTLFAMSVNEENACGGRVVTAPTNGAAGVIPAVIAYYSRFISRDNQKGIREFLATAAAIGAIIKMNATISGAEAGCQAEVGSACSMAAAALVAVQGGTIDQVENAAEIGMEHHLGMTCDPIAGLVQIPCIERNGMAAIKAITAARLAMRGDGNHAVSLDSCVETMYRTGLDLQAKYRETSQGGLAIYAKEPSSKTA
ncbi:L-serine ammonia-lyase [Endozoicomonas euniceicola]|uniref:L-serine dehydratase n=1 Tax=Endozoicomonas euniceicola TaxID=1234143 RepID=A0ABY6GT34_9GAMM|nr:L-serine ammonia-lyase [Endozoicomonas euniceicola]UYM15722.1 L-serine ammonia-lyase [Endozoicomonas euniceicola]